MSEPFKTCSCGRVYKTRAEWDEQPGWIGSSRSGVSARRYYDHDGSLVEQRVCNCGSHITAMLVPCLDVEDLRKAVLAIDSMREDFNTEYSAQELLRLVTICWLSGWDILPDRWTKQQVARALESGAAPRWSDDERHALDVSDCPCRGCVVERACSQSKQEESDA